MPWRRCYLRRFSKRFLNFTRTLNGKIALIVSPTPCLSSGRGRLAPRGTYFGQISPSTGVSRQGGEVSPILPLKPQHRL